MLYPAALPAVAVLAGVICGWRQPTLGSGVVALLVVIAWLAALLVVSRRPSLSRGVVLPTVALAFLLVGALLGGQATTTATTSTLQRWYEQDRSAPDGPGPVVIEGRLRRDATPTDYGASLSLDVDAILSPSGTQAVSGGATVTVGGQLASGRVADWVAGRRLRMSVTLRRSARYLNPGVPDQRTALMWRGTSLLGSVKSALLVEVVEPGGWWSETAAVVRAEVRDRVAQTVGGFSRRSAGVVTAVLIGDRAGLEREDQRRLREAGTYHVIAISGGNIAILAGVLLLTLRLARCDGRVASAVTVACLIAYASVVGSEASVMRATFAAGLFLIARTFDHRTPALNTLALSATCLVAFSPLTIVDPGFLLTFGATLGLLVGVEPLTRGANSALQSSPRIVRTTAMAPLALLAATVCAELALFPLAAAIFSRVTVAGLLLNFAAIPLMTVAQIAGMLAVAASPLTETGARLAGYVAHLSASGIVESARLMDVLPWLSRRVPDPPIAVVAVYYLGWATWLSAPGRLGLRVISGISVLAAGGLMLAGPVPPMSPLCSGMSRAVRILFLDVDQADATLVNLPSGHSVLVDAGGTVRGSFDVGGRIVSQVLWKAGVRRLDYLVLTHGDPDHIGGAPSVIADLRPREVWEGVPVPASQALGALKTLASEKGGAWRTIGTGDELTWAGVTLRVVHPPPPDWERPKVRNDDSVVLELRYGEVSVILPGDIGSETERSLVGSFQPASFRVLKVPHHGSRTSSSKTFITTLRPDAAVISAGRENPFGHPHPEVVQRYTAAGAEVWQTGEVGAISVCTDGRAVRLETHARQVSLVAGSPVDLDALPLGLHVFDGRLP